MPEMKRNFAKGKMNKDLDERLVPNGEYRDAMNVQVSTADDSDVGTVQNLLGNIEGCNYNFNNKSPIPLTAFTVGSVTDEKNDTLYWLVSGQDIDYTFGDDNFDYSQVNFTAYNLSLKDIIMRKTPNGCEPVFVDKYAFTTTLEPSQQSTTNILSNISDHNILDAVEPGWTVVGITPGLSFSDEVIVTKVSGKDKIPFNYDYSPQQQAPDPIGPMMGPISIIGFCCLLLDQFNLLDLFIPLLAKITNITSPISPTLAMAPAPIIAEVNFSDKLIINPDSGNVIPAEWKEGDEIHFLKHGNANVMSGCIGEINIEDDDGEPLEEPNIKVVDCSSGAVITPPSHGFDGYLVHGELNAIHFNENLALGDYARLFFKGPRTLNFNHNQLITGLNIIDDMLFWTDNKTEPKKINISRSIEGTHPSGTKHTLLVNEPRDYGLNNINKEPVREKHITVIRKSPKNSLSIELIDARDPYLTYAAVMTTGDGVAAALSDIIFSDNATVDSQGNFSGLAVGDTIRFSMLKDTDENDEFELAWKEGDKILLKEFTSDGFADSVPLASWTIRGEIKQWEGYTSFQSVTGVPAQIELEVLGLDGTPPIPEEDKTLRYVVDLEIETKTIFELKFPRFSYRYKYEDGEYSTFAPWSEVAFLPGGFDYDPKEGFNTGMTNRTEEIKLKNFISQDIPEDVVSVDILYKEEASPNIYIVDTISPLDDVVDDELNYWYLNEYKITSETVKATLASNQMLRPWDNVPIKALAQEVSGNRLIYANYLQGHDLQKINAIKYKPNFKNSLDIWDVYSNNVPGKSIKSLRDYKLGVVFTDKYGRETPILTSESGGFKINKKDSVNTNRLKVGLRGNAPDNMEYFKFYIKETSSEYYNLPMDRWYDAEDGNIWLAFPSSDRNKVDIDTTLYLKKGEGSDIETINNTNKYKILALEGEAPRFIKTRKLNIGDAKQQSDKEVNTDPTYGQVFGAALTIGEANLTNAPLINYNSFSLNYVEGQFGSGSVSRLEDIKEDLYIHFKVSGLKSNEYKISQITSDRGDQDPGDPQIPSKYFVTLDRPFEEDIDIIYDSPVTPTRVKDGVRIVFVKEVVENSPKFDGRFFAKIKNDGEVKVDITGSGSAVAYEPVEFKMVYALKEDPDLLKVAAESHKAYGEDPGVGAYLRNYINPSTSYNAKLVSFAPTYEPKPATNIAYFNNAMRVYNARQAYFGYIRTSYIRDIGGTDYIYSTSPFTSMEHSAELGKLASDTSTDYTSDPGVWFIDLSTHMYSSTSVGNNGNAIWWEANGSNDSIDPPKPGEGNGLQQYPGAGKTKLNLAIGGIFDQMKWNDRTISWSFQSDSFWDVGNSNTKFEPFHGEFIKRLDSGFSFRWKEDPKQTIYTIEGGFDFNKKIRFSQGFGRKWKPYSGIAGQGVNDNNIGKTNLVLKNQVRSPSSYHKTYKITVTPHMEWDPVDGLFIENGLKIGGKYQTISSGFNIAADVIESLAGIDITKVKPGMHVFGANVDAKVIEVNPTGSTAPALRLDNPATGTGATADIGFTIRYKGGDINPGPGENMYIEVDNIYAACDNSNTEEDTYPLHKGMLLETYNNGTATSVNNNAIIKKISEPDSSGIYKITLTGYNEPIKSAAHIDGSEFTTAFLSDKTIVFSQVEMNGVSNKMEDNTDIMGENNMWDTGLHGIGAVGYELQFLQAIEEYEDGGVLPRDPFVWETEPKENTELDIYYEISENNPINLDRNTIKTAIPIGSQVKGSSGQGWLQTDGLYTHVSSNLSGTGDIITTSIPACVDFSGCVDADGNTTWPLEEGSLLKITKPNGVIFSVRINEIILENPTDTHTDKFRINTKLLNANYRLNWHNCYSFGNGVESNRIRDNFNLPFILNGVKASTTLTEDYQEERRKYGLIYSGIYNSTSGVNNLNQFIAAEKITKEINPTYSSIQKLYAGWGQQGSLIALCEDRILKILADKDALFNADGDTNVVATNRVLGTATPYSGEYGISTNPESFAAESYRAYFTDKVRGTVMRLSMDGLTPISDYGMKDWFRDNLKLSNKLVGSYDDKKSEYNITLKGVPNTLRNTPGYPTTVTYKEDVKGWVSFKSFVPENAISCANNYYTFKNGELWMHHDETPNKANNFYGIGTFNSDVTVIFNDVPGTIKSFKTLNYEGSQARVVTPTNTDASLPKFGAFNQTLKDGEYFNLQEHDGWYVDDTNGCNTHCEIGKASDFIEKECKWFAYLIGNDVGKNGRFVEEGTFITSDFNVQGIGTAPIGAIQQNPGCTDPLAFNYDINAEVDDGSCIAYILGCMDSSASNYDPSANHDPANQCIIYGCTQEFLSGYDNDYGYQYLNFNPSATNDDGSCILAIAGCTDPFASNYNQPPSMNVQCGGNYLVPGDGLSGNNYNLGQLPNYCCISATNGCTDPEAYNHNVNATTDDGSCYYAGCMDPAATNYNKNCDGETVVAAVDDGCCIIPGCMDVNACNYNSTATIDDGYCELAGCMDSNATNYNASAICDDGSCIYAIDCLGVTNGTAVLDQCGVCDGDGTSCLGCIDPTATNYDPAATIDDGSCIYPVPGCTDPLATNYNPIANTDDGSCNYDILGCTDPLATNYNALANIDNSSCTYPISGCTDPTANNYNATATVDDGSCTYDVLGCTDPTANNYDALATVDDGSCTYDIPGCTDPLANNYNAAATIDDGTCTYDVPGCTDPTATNYDPLANVDDSSCVYVVIEGCTDPASCNHDPTATVDDGSCCSDPANYAGLSYACCCNSSISTPGSPGQASQIVSPQNAFVTVQIINVSGVDMIQLDMHTQGSRFEGRQPADFIVSLKRFVDCYNSGTSNAWNAPTTDCFSQTDPIIFTINPTSGGTDNASHGSWNIHSYYIPPATLGNRTYPLALSATPEFNEVNDAIDGINWTATGPAANPTGATIQIPITSAWVDITKGNNHNIFIDTRELHGFVPNKNAPAGFPSPPNIGSWSGKSITCGLGHHPFESGCMDSAHALYNPNAVIDDGSCPPIVCPPDPFTAMFAGSCRGKGTTSYPIP